MPRTTRPKAAAVRKNKEQGRKDPFMTEHLGEDAEKGAGDGALFCWGLRVRRVANDDPVFGSPDGECPPRLCFALRRMPTASLFRLTANAHPQPLPLAGGESGDGPLPPVGGGFYDLINRAAASPALGRRCRWCRASAPPGGLGGRLGTLPARHIRLRT